eukprot:m.113633 g.113633  ORF g.113633 m.113633 type:complete len:85 (+) comp14139_c0_seq2:2-256(+)
MEGQAITRKYDYIREITLNFYLAAKADAHVAVVMHADDLRTKSTVPLKNTDLWRTKENPSGHRMSIEIVMREGTHVLPKFILQF